MTDHEVRPGREVFEQVAALLDYPIPSHGPPDGCWTDSRWATTWVT